MQKVIVLCLNLFICQNLTEPANIIADAQFPNITSDGAWSWSVGPKAIAYKNRKNKTYLGWVDRQYGGVYVASIENTTFKKRVSFLRTLWHDDHVNPALNILPTGHIIAFYCDHNGSKMYYRTTKNPEDIRYWNNEKTIKVNFGEKNVYTYPNIAQLSEENDKLYLFWRGGNLQPTFSWTENYKDWAPAKELVNLGTLPYTQVYTNGRNTIHFAFNKDHPNNSVQNHIYYLKYVNGSFYKANGNKIGTLDDLPFNEEQLDPVYLSDLGGPTRVWDVTADENENASIVFSIVADRKNHRYMHSFSDGVNWITNFITDAGKGVDKTFGKTSAGLGFHHSKINEITFGKEINGIHEIFLASTNNFGQDWIIEQISYGSKLLNHRPVIPYGYKDGIKILWLYGVFNEFNNFKTGVLYYKP